MLFTKLKDVSTFEESYKLIIYYDFALRKIFFEEHY